MDLPTPREVELETLLRQRDVQLAQITDEITHLRQYVLSKPQDPPADPVSLPPALTALLLPHLNPTSKGTNASSSGPGSSSTAALTQRLRLLQEENDDLYQLLKQGETGKLKEEVRALRRLVERLEGALRESHQVVHSLSTELEKSYEAILTTAPRAESPTTLNHHKSHSRSPRNSYHVPLPNNSNGTTASSSSSSKLPPTGPRAHKKPRLSSPPPAGSSSVNNRHHHSSSSSSSRPGADTRSAQTSPHRDRGKAGATANNHHAPTPPARMEVDEQPQLRGGKEREKEYHKDMRHRDRERREERERDGGAGRRDRRSAGGGGGRGGGAGGGGGRRGAQAPATAQVIASSSSSGSASAAAAAAGQQGQGGDRTLKERMGL
ncbi:hypothetical protein R3P38DRAFT_2758272 [Favolaschia claudopus]|uniref:Uncharacterized protein n=1 Tax=Favolaschia claudopus TaxID=2862362 RepID=A0AAW0ECP4_9AGAR